MYYNLLFQQGERGYSKLSEAGVDAIVSADLPVEESEQNIEWLHKYGIGAVQMIAPNTSDERAELQFLKSNAYTYALSGFGVTGVKKEVSPKTIERVKHLKTISDKPIIVGFGISKPEHAQVIWNAGAEGAIVGSYFTSIIEDNLDNIDLASQKIQKFICQVNQLK